MSGFESSRAASHASLEPEATARWLRFGQSERVNFPVLLGLTVVDVRVDYCRMRLPFRPEILQAAGLVHGGAIASLLDAVMVPAVGAVLEHGSNFATVDMHVQFIRAIRSGPSAEDAIAEGWVTRRGRRTVFCESEAYGEKSGDLLAKSVLTYAVSPPKS